MSVTEKTDGLGPLVNNAGQALVVVAMPQESYDLIVETLELDSESSAFDEELREQIAGAVESMTEVTDELHQLLVRNMDNLLRIAAVLNLANPDE